MDKLVGFDTNELRGKPVETYDEDHLGIIEDVIEANGRRYLVVKGDLLGTGRYYVPGTEIERIGERRVLLKTTRDDLQELDWFAPPEGYSP